MHCPPRTGLLAVQSHCDGRRTEPPAPVPPCVAVSGGLTLTQTTAHWSDPRRGLRWPEGCMACEHHRLIVSCAIKSLPCTSMPRAPLSLNSTAPIPRTSHTAPTHPPHTFSPPCVLCSGQSQLIAHSCIPSPGLVCCELCAFSTFAVRHVLIVVPSAWAPLPWSNLERCLDPGSVPSTLNTNATPQLALTQHQYCQLQVLML